MKVLVLHNNNVPFFLRNPECNQIDDIKFDEKLLKFDSNIETRSFDSFVSSQLDFLKDSFYDIILLPFTLSVDNYLEYTGLRVAAHIRLTPIWEKITTPILFIGPDTFDDVTKLSNFGSIVSSHHVFMTDKNEEQSIISLLHEILKKYPGGDDDRYLNSSDYKKFLDSFNIKAPANYSTHHSIANEWAIIRWIQMFSWEGSEPVVKNKEISESLYFKQLIAKVGTRESFTKKWKKKNPIDPIIRGIEGKKILYIDDDAEKGWYDLLNAIFKNSKAELICYHFENMSKEDLFKSLKSFVDSNKADCYLIDLRLHDDDFKEDTLPYDYTGIKIARYIKGINIGNQVIMFTASNKTWNYEAAIKEARVSSYIVKESPEYNYTRKDSYSNFCKFSDVIQNAIRKSYIADYSDIIDDFDFLENEHRNPLINFIEMLELDEKRTIKTNILNLSVFIERYVLDHFTILGNALVDKNTFSRIIGQCNFRDFCFYDDYQQIIINNNTPKESHIQLNNEKYKALNPKKNLGIIILTLYYYFDFSIEECNMYLRFRKERNNNAHQGEELDYSLADIRLIFERLVLKMLNKGNINNN